MKKVRVLMVLLTGMVFAAGLTISCAASSDPLTLTITHPAAGTVETNATNEVRIDYEVSPINFTNPIDGVYISDNSGTFTKLSDAYIYGGYQTFSAGAHTLSFYAKSQDGTKTATITRQIVATN
ncbi:MAG: hypothetical protein A2014_01095 [Spirochaetes bacterium GWF1_49_6]|nr:MAG: hypothetical protein A2014_01095 [Spirochaetes bacterium GWF1_49_6]